MEEKLLALEKCFFDETFIADEKWLDSVIHCDFLEYGKSGSFFRKADTIEGLLSCSGNREIEINDFSCEEVVADCWLVHYVTESPGEKYYRTSLWVRENGCLQLRFHQASAMK